MLVHVRTAQVRTTRLFSEATSMAHADSHHRFWRWYSARFIAT